MSYKPIEDYGIIGDLRTIALISTDGSLDFLCWPHFDSPSIFVAMLGHGNGGKFQIGPAVPTSRHKQLYLPDTNVLITRFLSDEGVGEVMDFMPVGEQRHTHAVVRRVQGVRGPFTFRINCAPAFNYARDGHEVRRVGPGEYLFVPTGEGNPTLRLRTPVELEIVDGAAVGELTLDSDETVDFVLEVDDPQSGHISAQPGWVDSAFQHTVDFWRHWIGSTTYQGRWQEMVNRSALTLKLLTSEKTGAIAAAGTFGLPEMVGGERNWDYRFTWIRDASFTAAALIRLGFRDEARALIGWIEKRYHESEEKGKLQIMYGIDGRQDLTEEVLEHLEGYRTSAPVRIGNAAYNQLQLDIYGELLNMVDLFDKYVEPISYDTWTHMRESVDWTAANWQRTDEGIWEVRGGQREFLYSRLMSWVAIDRGIRLATRRSLPAPIVEWRLVRDEIHAEIYDGFWSEERQAFVQSKGSTTIDASTLLMPLVGFIAPRDPRWLSTLAATEADLVDDSLVYRYRAEDAASDGLAGTEGTFCMCSYWFVECLARAGQLDKARLFFEKMNGYSNHLGLYAEEMGPTGSYLGNFPQAFTHLGLVSAAMCLDEALSVAER
jgi:GH15 family glucan-1,4-alpha-glucosidase